MEGGRGIGITAMLSLSPVVDGWLWVVGRCSMMWDRIGLSARVG